MDRKPDKVNKNIEYYDDEHLYIDTRDNKKAVSVTTLIHHYTQPFDSDFWSSYKALENLMGDDFKDIKKILLATKKFNNILLKNNDIDEETFYKKKEEILQSYANENKISCDHGTSIHSEKENQYYKSKKHRLDKFGLNGDFICKRNYYELDLDKGIYPEYLIYKSSSDDILRVAGQIDLLIKDGNDIYIYDYKGLPLDTPLATPDGWTYMKDICEGDIVYDKNGNKTKVLHVSEIHNNPCYKINFDNSESIVCDHEHRWEISFNIEKDKYIQKVLTTEELLDFMKVYDYTPKILNTLPINTSDIKLPTDPYILGRTLGLDLLNNEYISNMYLRSSYNQRLDLIRGIMDIRGSYQSEEEVFVMNTKHKWLVDDFEKLISSLGWRSIKSEIIELKSWNIYFYPTVNPFLKINQDINLVYNNSNSFRTIVSIDKVDTVQTRCIEVDSDTHTYLAGYTMIPTHNTNKEIKQKSYFNRNKHDHENMKFPLNNIMDCNFMHYTLQLSLYAYLLQQINPEFNIKSLKLIHIDREGKETEYEVEYLKSTVIKLLQHYKKQIVVNAKLDKDKIKY